MSTKSKELSELGSILSVTGNTANIDGSVIVSNTITIGNSTVNTTFSATSVNANTVGGNTALDLRNYTDDKAANAYTNATTFAANATNISSGTLNTDRLPATVNVATAVNIGSNVNINTSTIFIGNSTVNTTIQAGNISLLGTQLTVGNTVFGGETIVIGDVNVNTSAVSVGNSTVNTVIVAATLTNVNTAITSNASTAYSNGVTYTDNKAANAYTNATTFASNASNITTGTLTANVLPTSGVTANIYGNSSQIPVITIDATGRITSATVNAVAGVTSFTYTEANNTFAISTGDGSTFTANIGTANATHTGVIKVLDSVANSNTTIAASVSAVKTAYDTAITANTSAASAYSNAVTYADNKAANAYSNAVSYAATIAGTAYSNGVTYTDNKAANAYSNATTFASNASNISSGTLAEARLPFRMDQNVRTSDNVSFHDATISGNLTVNGTTVTINATELAIEDNMIYLNEGTQGANVHPDLGFSGAYNDGTYRHAGFFRDASDAVWKVYDQYLPEPDASPFIDTANASFRIANFQANVVTAASFSGNGASVTSVDAASVGGNTAGTLRSYSDSVAGTAYTNAVSVSSSSAATAYSNAVNYFTTNYTASDVLTKIKTVDGTGSGLDADTVDGYDASSFALKTDPEFTNDITTSSGQGRFGGWYVGTGYTGEAFEVGISSGEAYALAYNRGTSSYLNMNFGANDFEFSGQNSGFAHINTSFRAPIFYDSANTSYYVDPASISVLSSLLVSGGVVDPSSVGSGVGVGTITESSTGFSAQGIAFGSGAGQHGAIVYASTTMYFGTETGSDNTLNTRATLNSSGTFSVTGDVRAPIFYDSANTSFYVDPASVSNIFQLNVNGSHQGGFGIVKITSTDDSLVSLSTNNNATAGIRLQNALSDITFVGKKASSSSFVVDHGFSQTSEEFIVDTSGNIFASTSARAPIFYDSNNTAYYTDPNSDSRVARLLVSDGGNYIRIGNEGEGANASYARIRTNGSGALFLDSKDGQALYLNWYSGSGPIYSESSANFPVYYDRSNSAYYVDPASGTNLAGTLTNNGGTAMTGGWNRNLYLASTFPVVVFNSNNTKYSGIGVDYSVAAGGFYFWVNGSSADISGTGTAAMNIDTGNFVNASGSFRAPIFYDSNDTGYYGDFASGSSLKYLRVNGDWNTSPFGSGHANFTITGTYASIYQTATNGSLGYMLQHIASDGSFYLYSGRGAVNGSSWDWGFRQLPNQDGNYCEFRTSARAPIFYDSGNTGYYLDPAGTSNVNAMVSYQYQGNGNVGGTGSASWHPSGIYSAGYNWLYGGINAGAASVTNMSDARANIFYDYNDTGYYLDPNSTTSLRTVGDWRSDSSSWTGEFSGKIQYHSSNWYLQAAGELIFRNSGGTNVFTVNQSGVAIASSDYRAPIFYDSNNTGYYMDLNNTSYWATSQQNGWHYFNQNYGHGVVGLYASTRYQCVYAMGDSYKGNADGTSLSGAYGLWWSYPSAGGPAGNLSSHGLMCIVNGNFYASLDASMRAVTDMRAPIFYDYNNTGYYCDPASTSYLYHLILSGASYFRPSNWIQMDGSYGMYWPNTNGAHLEGNTLSSYGSIAIRGSRNGWRGIHFYEGGNVPHLMFDGSANGGIYYETGGRWAQYYHYGNVCQSINTSTSSSSYGLYVSGSIYSTANIVAASDARLKENVFTVDNALEKVNQLRGVYYNRIDDEEKKRKVGVIAQEINEVVPEVVTYDKENDQFGVDYGNLAGVFIEAIKQLTDEIKTLKKEIEILKTTK